MISLKLLVRALRGEPRTAFELCEEGGALGRFVRCAAVLLLGQARDVWILLVVIVDVVVVYAR